MADLKGKAGIVTGGSSGIGFQIANVLAEAGATAVPAGPKRAWEKAHRALST